MILLLVLFISLSQVFAWQSAAVYRDSITKKLQYGVDDEGRRLPNFSHAGYAASERELPELTPTVFYDGPSGADDQPGIQRVLDSIGNLNMQTNGFRGVLYLPAGNYKMSSPLIIDQSGVVLQGAGSGNDGTVLDFKNQKLAIKIGGGNSDGGWKKRLGTPAQITTDFVALGEYKIAVDHPEYFSVGERVVLDHPSTEVWLDAIDGGGISVSSKKWAPGDADITYNRKIKEIAQDTLVLDAPVFNDLNRNLSVTKVYRYNDSGLKSNIGVENIKVVFDKNIAIENNGIFFEEVIDAWAKNVVIYDVTRDGFKTHTALQVTITQTTVRGFSNVDNGGWAYLYNLDESSQLILIKNSKAYDGRHNFISNGKSSVSGCVFLNVESGNALYNSEGHRLWTQGLLFDNLVHKGPMPNNDRVLALMNRNDKGSGHGWATVNSVVYNSDLNGGDLWIQKPPTAQNWSIGVKGLSINKGFGDGEDAWVETFEGEPEIPSLFLAQLKERLNEDEITLLSPSPQNISNTTWLQIGNQRFQLNGKGLYRINYRDTNGRLIHSELREAPGEYPRFEASTPIKMLVDLEDQLKF